MRTTCLVNNYNYDEFVIEAVDSAFAQAPSFDEVIVVDDGSTDDSLTKLSKRSRDEPRLLVVEKPNGGQLSAFKEGLRHANGELIFFLDADDVYLPGFLGRALSLYGEGRADFLVAGRTDFGPGASDRSNASDVGERSLGFSLIRTLLSDAFVGGPTSSLSMRRWVAEKALAYPHDEDWRIRADDVLAVGASLVGARKHQFFGEDFGYRKHGGNNFIGRARDAEVKYRHTLARNRLVAWHAEREGYTQATLMRRLYREFCTIERPTSKETRAYLKYAMRRELPLMLKARNAARILWHYAQERARPDETNKRAA